MTTKFATSVCITSYVEYDPRIVGLVSRLGKSSLAVVVPMLGVINVTWCPVA